MRTKSRLLPSLFVLSIAVLVVIIYLKHRDRDSEQITSERPTLTLINPEKTGENSVAAEELTPMNDLPEVRTDTIVDPVVTRPELFEVMESDMTPFLRSEVAAKWIEELGYTQSELVQAQRDLRAQGYDETRVNDAGIIMRHLPVRHRGRITVSEIDVPSTAKAGEPIPFTLRGRKPSPSHSFTGFDILIQGPIIRINAQGHSDGDNNAGPGGRVELEGEIGPLEKGIYNVIVPELGPDGSYEITVN